MKKNYLSMAMTGLMLSLTSLTLPLVSDLPAADLFTKITTGEIVNDGGASVGGSWADYDNDGWLDLFVANTFAQNDFLYHNNGDGTFTRVTVGPLVSDGVNSSGPTWGDYDNDGYLDLYVSNNPGPRFLYRNNRDGTFIKETESIIFTDSGAAAGNAWGDYDNDGDLDLFVCTPNGNNVLYRNDGDGDFTKMTTGSPVNEGGIGFGCAWADYDNDGWLDLFVCNGSSVSVANNFLYHNNGDGTFTKITSGAIVNDSGRWSRCAWGDYDNDSFLDLFVTDRTGNNALYHNNGDGTFTRITTGSLVNDGGNSFGCAWGDYDNDGFLDLFVGNGRDTGNENNFHYRNNGNSNRWIKLRLVGTLSNRFGIGAKIKVNAVIGGTSRWLMRPLEAGEFTGNASALVVGLGDATLIETLRIEWPSGTVQELQNVAAQQFLTVTEPGGEPRLTVTQENGQVQLTLTGKQGSRYAIETSTTLPNWTSAALTVTVTNPSGAVTFPAPGTTGGAQRFYRALWQ